MLNAPELGEAALAVDCVVGALLVLPHGRVLCASGVAHVPRHAVLVGTVADLEVTNSNVVKTK